jgi:hypothetical protein
MHYIIILIFYLFYIFWRYHSSLHQIKHFYYQTELKKIIHYADKFCLKRNKYILYNLLPYQDIENILNMHDCLLDSSFVESYSSYLFKTNIDTKALTLYTKKKNNYIQYLSLIFNSSNILHSIKQGKFTMNIIESLKVETISKINIFILKIKNIQNEIEYSIKQIIMESSYLFSLIINLFHFILWSISIITFFLSYKGMKYISLYNYFFCHDILIKNSHQQEIILIK